VRHQSITADEKPLARVIRSQILNRLRHDRDDLFFIWVPYRPLPNGIFFQVLMTPEAVKDIFENW
jgi:hypothetical protein